MIGVETTDFTVQQIEHRRTVRDQWAAAPINCLERIYDYVSRLIILREKKAIKLIMQCDKVFIKVLMLRDKSCDFSWEATNMAPTPLDIAEIVREAREFEYPRVVTRDDVISALPEPQTFNLVHIITGIRRCGKTFYAFQRIERLLAQGVDRDRVFYFNFSDDRLRPAPPSLMNDVIEEFWRQSPKARTDGCYLFLDEVQEADDWQGFCQRLAEHEKVTLVITGSSSKLSADDIATEFRGRSQEHPMHPLSFREYCAFHDIAAPEATDLAENGAVAPQTRTQLESAFDCYLVDGGFPGVQMLDEGSRIQMLQAYLRDVVARDVMERSARTEISLANQVGLFCLRNTACDLSINNLADGLRSVGYKVSWEKIKEIVRLFVQAHLIGLLPEYAMSLSPSKTSLDKVYAIDQGMAYATSRANQQDVGKRLETAVYMELMRRTSNGRMETVTSYTASTTKREKVDFLVGDALAMEPYELYQVTVDMTAEKTRRRELGSLQVAMGETGIEKATVITLREETTVGSERGQIRVIPAWKWALMDSR